MDRWHCWAWHHDCTKCGKKGHAEHVCKQAKQTNLASSPCLCCGKQGHVKSECHHKDKNCSVCDKKGHTKDICHAHFANQNGTAGASTGRLPSDTPEPTVSTGPILTWHCKPRGSWVLPSRKQCPGCKANKPKETVSTNPLGQQPRGVVECTSRWEPVAPGQMPELTAEEVTATAL